MTTILRLSQTLFLLGLLAISIAVAKRAPQIPKYESAAPLRIDGNLVIDTLQHRTLQITFQPALTKPAAISGEQFLREWLNVNYAKLGLSQTVEISLQSIQQTPGGDVYRFYQSQQGVQSFENDFVAQFDTHDRLISIHQTLDSQLRVKSCTPLLTQQTALNNAINASHAIGENFPPQVTLQLWLSETNTPHLVWRVILTPTSPLGEYELLVDAYTGEILRTTDRACYVNGSGMAFHPDPITTAQQTYTGNFRDLNDGDNASLNGQRFQRPLREITQQGSTISLVGPWVRLLDFEAPTGAPVTATNADSFRFTRSQQGFEDVMCYAHLDSSQRWIQSLGFNNIQHAPISVDPHGLNGDDNSYFLPASNRLAFGEGGVDDDEDVDVIWHEYGHAIQRSQVSNWGGGESGSLGEGFGDYWAGSYSNALSTYRREWVYNWDGHNEFWDGRILNTTATYPSGMGSVIHTNGQIWSRALMDIHFAIGREITDRIVLQGQFAVGSGVTYPTLANATINADILLYGGAHVTQIFSAFQSRGILTTMPTICSLTGIVRAHTGGQVLSNVIVSVEGTPRDTTDVAGRYQFGNLSIATYQISFSHASFSTHSEAFQFVAAGPDTLDVELYRPRYRVTPDTAFTRQWQSDSTFRAPQIAWLHNTGDDAGHFRLSAMARSFTPPYSLIDTINLSAVTGIGRLIGVTWLASVNAWYVSGTTGSANYIDQLSSDLTSVVASVTVPGTGSIGVRDMGNRNQLVYGGTNDSLFSWQHPGATNRTFVCRLPVNPPRAVSIIERTAQPEILAADLSTPVYQLRMDGTQIRSYTNTYSITAIASSTTFDWVISNDASYTELWLGVLDSVNSSVQRIARLYLPTGYRSNGATICVVNGQAAIGVLLYSSSANRTLLARYALPGGTSSMSISPVSGVLNAGDSLAIELTASYQNHVQDQFVIRQENQPGAGDLFSITIQWVTAIDDHASNLPQRWSVESSYPNPFNSFISTRIHMPVENTLQFALYDITGREIATRKYPLQAGVHVMQFHSEHLSSGVYFARYQVGSEQSIQRWVYMK